MPYYPPKEEWRPIAEFGGRYEVSNYGYVRSLTKKIPQRVSPFLHAGYKAVALYTEAGQRRVRKVHRLVLEAFVGSRPPGCVARHLSGDPMDNRLENLCWDSTAENNRDILRHSGFNPNANLSIEEETALNLLEEWEAWEGTREAFLDHAEERYGVGRGVASDVVEGKTWGYLLDQEEREEARQRVEEKKHRKKTAVPPTKRQPAGNSDGIGDRTRTHGQSTSPEYKTWAGILSACHNPKDTNYDYYGGKGLEVCEEWHSFEEFLADVGNKPEPGYSLVRLDKAQGFHPSNCEWRKPDKKTLEYQGEEKTLHQWSRETGIKYSTLVYRQKKGWTPAQILGKESPTEKRGRPKIWRDE